MYDFRNLTKHSYFHEIKQLYAFERSGQETVCKSGYIFEKGFLILCISKGYLNP